MRNYFELKKDIENEIRSTAKHVAFYADNLSKNGCKSVSRFLQMASKKYEVDYHIEGNVQNILHDNTDFYKPYIPKKCDNECKDDIGWMAVELTNIMRCDEVWVFDNGYDNFKLNGRLDKVLTSFKKPVRFLCMAPDGNSWDFYKGRDVVNGKNNELQNDYYLVVDEYGHISEYNDSCNNKEDDMHGNRCGGMDDKQTAAMKMRPVSKDALTDEEYGLVFNALQFTQFMGSLALKASVRNDNRLLDKINPFIKTGNEILLDILGKDKCDEKTLKLCQAKLDFAIPDVENLIDEYNL